MYYIFMAVGDIRRWWGQDMAPTATLSYYTSLPSHTLRFLSLGVMAALPAVALASNSSPILFLLTASPLHQLL